MLITVVRHAESLGNAGLASEVDPLLSPRGIEQARLTAERLAAEAVTHIWSSPFRRAIHTASFVAQATGVEVVLEPEMVEHYIFDDLEEYQGRTREELLAEFEFARLAEHFGPGRWTPKWGETWDELLVRTRRVAERGLELVRGSTSSPRARPRRVGAVAHLSTTTERVHLVIFGHGASTKGLVTALIGEEIARDAGFVNAGMSRARVDSALPGEPIFLNDASHLKNLEGV